MRIVVLDGYTLNPGDLSWDDLAALGECEVHDRTPPDETVPRCAGAEIVLTNKVVLDRARLERLPDLRYIGVTATGCNIVDARSARGRGVVVTNVPDYATPAVVQTVFAHLLELTHHVGHHSQTVRDGRWSESPDFAYWDYPLVELKGLVMGIVGLGRIGTAVAEVARAFGMTVLACTEPPQPPREGVEFVELARLLGESDVVSLHCPLTPETEGLAGAEHLALMKPSAFLINTGRGPLVDEAALARALNAGRLAGAGLDVLSSEPPPPDHPLLAAANCLITPHVAWAARAARVRLMKTVVENVKAFLAGRPQNVVT